MVAQPDTSRFSISSCTLPLDRRYLEPDQTAFDRLDIALFGLGDEPLEPVQIGTALAFRLRMDEAHDLLLAVDAEPNSLPLEEVCLNALEEDGELKPELADVIEGRGSEILVLDQIQLSDPADDVPLLWGLMARGVLDHIGTPSAVLFLPPRISQEPSMNASSLASSAASWVVLVARSGSPAYFRPIHGALSRS